MQPISTERLSAVIFSWLQEIEPGVVGAQTADWQPADLAAARWIILVHGIAPLLYKSLHPSAAWQALPPPLQEYLADQYTLNGLRTRVLMQELVDLLQLAATKSVAVIPLKGSVLCFHYYDDPALRPMADVDILVHAEDEPALSALLPRLGYEPSEAQTTSRHRSYALARYGQAPVFTEGEHPANPHWLDVHVKIQERNWGMRYDITEDLWRTAQKAFFGAAPGLLPSPSALLQHLLIHTSADLVGSGLRLIRLYDIALVARGLPADAWQEVLQAGRQRGEERLLYAPLALADRYFGCQVPPVVWDQLRRGTPPALVSFLDQADAYLLSFCNPLGLTRSQKLSWYRPGRERLMALRERVLPAPEDLYWRSADLYKVYPLPVAYLVHVYRAVTEQMRPALHLPRRSWLKAAGRTGRSRTGDGTKPL